MAKKNTYFILLDPTKSRRQRKNRSKSSSSSSSASSDLSAHSNRSTSSTLSTEKSPNNLPSDRVKSINYSASEASSYTSDLSASSSVSESYSSSGSTDSNSSNSSQSSSSSHVSNFHKRSKLADTIPIYQDFLPMSSSSDSESEVPDLQERNTLDSSGSVSLTSHSQNAKAAKYDQHLIELKKLLHRMKKLNPALESHIDTPVQASLASASPILSTSAPQTSSKSLAKSNLKKAPESEALKLSDKSAKKSTAESSKLLSTIASASHLGKFSSKKNRNLFKRKVAGIDKAVANVQKNLTLLKEFLENC